MPTLGRGKSDAFVLNSAARGAIFKPRTRSVCQANRGLMALAFPLSHRHAISENNLTFGEGRNAVARHNDSDQVQRVDG